VRLHKRYRVASARWAISLMLVASCALDEGPARLRQDI